MTVQDSSARRRSEKYRRSAETKGQNQINVWIDQNLKDRLDEFVKIGGLRNRSEAVSMAVEKLIEESKH